MENKKDKVKHMKEEKVSEKKEVEQFAWKKNNITLLVATVVSLVVIFFISYYIFGGLGKVYYKDLVFTAERTGTLTVYHYYYYFNDEEGQQYKYNLYLRKDPSKNLVPIDGEISFSNGQDVYLSIDPNGLTNCSDSMIAIAHLVGFLTDNGIETSSATPDKKLALEQNKTYADCTTFPDNVVILIKEGNRTQITKENNCHILEVANCEILDAIEKFEVETVVDAKKKAN